MSKHTSHTMTILKRLLEGETLISSDIFASNTNQYFVGIKNQGIKLTEWNDLREGRHLKRKLDTAPDNIKRANEFLNRLKRIKAVA